MTQQWRTMDAMGKINKAKLSDIFRHAGRYLAGRYGAGRYLAGRYGAGQLRGDNDGALCCGASWGDNGILVRITLCVYVLATMTVTATMTVER